MGVDGTSRSRAPDVSTASILASVATIADLAAGGHGREKFIESSLRAVRDIGFERARYYELVNDVPRDARVAVLTAQVPAGSGRLFGAWWDFSTATMAGQSNDGPWRAVIGRADDDAEANPEWVETLGLVDRSWVEIPVTAADRLVGVIAADWEGAEAASALDLDALRTIGVQIGSHLGLKPIRLLEEYRKRPEELLKEGPDAVVKDALRRLADLLDVAVASIFSFSWPDQELRKIDEVVARPYRKDAERAGDLTEVYKAGEHLTGKAWQAEKFRHVPLFESLERYGSDLIEPRSAKWHARVLGEVRTVMYAVVGSLDQRYLIRLINRASRPELAFLGEEAALDALINDVRSDIDAAIATQRSTRLEEMAKLTAETVEPNTWMRSVAEALAEENVDNFAVAFHQRDASQFGFNRFMGTRFRGRRFRRSVEWQDDRLYSASLQAQAVHRVAEFEQESLIARVLAIAGFKYVLTLPLEAGQTRGVFLVPLDAAATGGRGGHRPPAEATFGTISSLYAYSRLIANAVETSHSRAKADGARRALGFMGHEIRMPLSQLGGAAELAINAAKRSIDELAASQAKRDELIASLEEHEETLYDRQDEISAALALAPIVAQESQGRLQLHFRSTKLVSVIREAIAEVQKEHKLDENRKAFDFIVRDSCYGLESVVCDRIYLRHVLRNLIRNAATYSLPRHSGVPMAIELIGEPQENWAGIKVRNWGWGIPDDMYDLIFEAWVRGNIQDDQKAIRGMGLGLFLARRIMLAHGKGGQVLCHSRPTLDDPRRREQLQGYETVFEVRVPRKLPEKTVTVVFDGGAAIWEGGGSGASS